MAKFELAISSHYGIIMHELVPVIVYVVDTD